MKFRKMSFPFAPLPGISGIFGRMGKRPLSGLPVINWVEKPIMHCVLAWKRSVTRRLSKKEKQLYNFMILRPSSDVVLLPCRTKLQFGSTVARQEINSDSDVVPESNQIQGLLKPRNSSPPNSPRERNFARTY